MSAAARLVLLATAVAAIGGCGQRSGNGIAPADNAAATDIETLPSDESDATPGDELANGDDEADAANAMATANTDTLQD